MSAKKQKHHKRNPVSQHEIDKSRRMWTRKPMTKIVTNKKAEQRRTMCRKKGTMDGAVVISAV